jgi:hypothetical protein
MTRNLHSAACMSVALALVLTGCPGDKGAPAGGGAAAPAGGGSAAPAAGKVDPAKAGTIVATAKFEGAAPAASELDMSGTAECHSQHPQGVKSETVLVKDGKVQNVIVSVKGAPASEPPAEAASIDQKGCMYTPHVITMQVNQPLKIKNSDSILHNVHALPKKNTEFNFGMPNVNQEGVTKKFKTPEIVKFRCDVHGWMGAYVGVFEHPHHGVTDAAGMVTLKGLPAGEYTLEAWHEKFGVVEQKVKVGEGETKNVEFTFKPTS